MENQRDDVVNAIEHAQFIADEGMFLYLSEMGFINSLHTGVVHQLRLLFHAFLLLT